MASKKKAAPKRAGKGARAAQKPVTNAELQNRVEGLAHRLDWLERRWDAIGWPKHDKSGRYITLMEILEPRDRRIARMEDIEWVDRIFSEGREKLDVSAMSAVIKLEDMYQPRPWYRRAWNALLRALRVR